MIGILKRPMDVIEASEKFMPAYITSVSPVEYYIACKRFERAISSEYTIPKKMLERLKIYASSPLARRIESAFL
jgi:hypothetical protein